MSSQYDKDAMNDSRITLTQKIIARILAEKKRTGAGIQKLFRGTNASRPVGLTSSSIVHNWLNGKSKTAEKSHVDWIFAAYRDYGTPKAHGMSSRIKINDELHGELIAEYERTKMGAVRILRHAMGDLPKGVNVQKVQSWMDRTSRSAKREHWDFVMALYAAVQTQK